MSPLFATTPRSPGSELLEFERASFTSPQIRDDPSGCVVPWRTGNTSAGMGSRAAQVQAPNGCPILSCPRVGAEAEELVQIVAAVEDVRLCQSVDRFEVQWAERLTSDDHVGEIGHHPAHVGDDPVGNLLLDVIPVQAIGQFVRVVLGEDAHDVLAWGRQAVIDSGRNRYLKTWFLG